MKSLTIRCYLCGKTTVHNCKDAQDFAGAMLAGFPGHSCKGGRELYHVPFEVIASSGQLEG